ncbi:Zinc finger, C2H2 [Penicillium digitatum]|uniref:Zinc finger, C2H2 n=1 Tax=Penicillium digitatum TaxID=36651 RepID=A0A7T7BQJ9_PENDI|nr:Zinc finger, C2H2 [Penicillium digitatum]
MSSTRESTHPLHTRVQFFAKLFSLHASAINSHTKNTQPIASEKIPEDIAESATDLDQYPTPTLPSDSEITPLLDWTEDVQDWPFDFETSRGLS